MTIPVSAQWDVLSFTEGTNLLGAVPPPNAVGFFVSAAESGGLHGEGVDWDANPAAGWGARYQRDLTDTIIVVVPGAFTQEIRMLVGDLAGVTRSWVEEAKVVLVTPAAMAVSSFSLLGNRAGDGYGSEIRVDYDSMTGLWDVLVRYPLAGMQSIGTYDLGLTVTLRMLFDGDRRSVRFWANDVYLTEMTAGGAGAPADMRLVLAGNGSTWGVVSWTVSTHPGYGTTKPRANAGPDCVVPLDRNAGFDGRNSSVNTGETPYYQWKLVGAPAGSSLIYSTGTQGSEIMGCFFQDASADFATNCSVGDTLVVDGGFYEVVAIPFPTVLQLIGVLPTGYVGTWQVILQDANLVQGHDKSVFSLDPPVVGLYLAQLTVMNDSGLLSAPDLAACNVVPAQVPLGVPLDMGFLWEYLSDFWRKVEGKDWAPAAWMGIARIAGAYLTELWNIDFDKSLATTQNVVTKRWYPVFPRLDEPYPDRCVFHSLLAPALGSVRFTKVAITTGVSPGTDISFQLDTEEGPKTLVVAVPAATAYSAVAGLVNAVLAADDWFSCLSVSFRLTETHELDLAGGLAYRLVTSSSSYGFSVSDSTGEYYTGTVVSRFEHDAVVASARTVLWYDYVDVDLLIKPGDILNLGSRSYNITNVSHWVGPTTYRHLQLEIDEDLPALLIGATVPSCIPSYWTSTTVDWWDEGVTAGDDLWLERRPLGQPEAAAELVHVRVAGAGPKKVCSDSPDVWWPYYYLINHVVRYSYVPVDEMVLSLPRLQEAPDAPEWVMEEYFHYLVDDRRDGRYAVLNFRDEPTDEVSLTLLYRDAAKVSFLPDYLWAEVALMDNRPIIEQVFGRMVKTYVEDFAASPDANYLSIVTALWQAYSKGPEPDVLNTAAAILSGVPYAEADGTITAVGVDFYPGLSYMLIRDRVQSAIVRCYVFQTGLGIAVNPTTGVAYAEGDSVTQFSLLVDTQIYYDYVQEPEWFKALRSGGAVKEVEKVHKFGLFMDADYTDFSLWTKVVDFILDIKKSNTYPFFAALRRLQTSIDITAEFSLTVHLFMQDAFWAYPVPPVLDAPRTGSGVAITPDPTEADSTVLFRMVVPGDVGDPPWTIAYRSDVLAPSVTLGAAHDYTVHYVRGVTTAAGVVVLMVGNPVLVAYLPAGAAGAGNINDDYGPVIVNHRGRPQLHFDATESPYPGVDGYSVLQLIIGDSIIDAAFGSNIVASVDTVAGPSGNFHRIELLAGGNRFHNWNWAAPAPIPPAPTDLHCEEDWVVFYQDIGGGVYTYRTMGKLVGSRSPIGEPVFGANVLLNWADVDILPGLPVPVAGDCFIVYRGFPHERIMDWSASTTETILGSGRFDNVIPGGGVVLVGGDTYTVDVAPGVPGHQFADPATDNTAMLPGRDYLLFFDQYGTIKTFAVLDLITPGVGIRAQVTLCPPGAPGSIPAPADGDSFIVLRDPMYTTMSAEFIQLIHNRMVGFDVPGVGTGVVLS